MKYHMVDESVIPCFHLHVHVLFLFLQTVSQIEIICLLNITVADIMRDCFVIFVK